MPPPRISHAEPNQKKPAGRAGSELRSMVPSLAEKMLDKKVQLIFHAQRIVEIKRFCVRFKDMLILDSGNVLVRFRRLERIVFIGVFAENDIVADIIAQDFIRYGEVAVPARRFLDLLRHMQAELLIEDFGSAAKVVSIDIELLVERLDDRDRRIGADLRLDLFSGFLRTGIEVVYPGLGFLFFVQQLADFQLLLLEVYLSVRIGDRRGDFLEFMDVFNIGEPDDEIRVQLHNLFKAFFVYSFHPVQLAGEIRVVHGHLVHADQRYAENHDVARQEPGKHDDALRMSRNLDRSALGLISKGCRFRCGRRCGSRGASGVGIVGLIAAAGAQQNNKGKDK
ncbi:hypothetical protein BN871_BM_00280 [Paenibacillus sp. P22]|nr:hypothetical protein BN871_BM_00280 [Paenibacillus sp. P22]